MLENLENQSAPASGRSFDGGGNDKGPFTAIGTSEPDGIIGIVKEVIENGLFQVCLENGTEVRTHLSGDAWHTCKNLKPGRKVLVDVSPYDATRGRIMKRLS